MADHADDGNDDVFVYMGGSVPQHLREMITHIRVHKSVKIITWQAFFNCRNLVSIEMHDGVEIIEEEAFYCCTSLREIKLPGVRVIERNAFWKCNALEGVEFGDKLESIEGNAFTDCISLRNIKIPKVRVIGDCAFIGCEGLTDAELSEDLESFEGGAFWRCRRLRRITMPSKDNLLGEDVFNYCDNLSQVDIIGGIHKTVSSLLLDSWRNEMNDVINGINRYLPNTDREHKTAAIRRWMETVIRRIEHYKSEHFTLLKEFTTLLELALWKTKLDESQDERYLGSDQPAKKAKIDVKAARQEKRITSGASIVIKNVLPFLKLE